MNNASLLSSVLLNILAVFIVATSVVMVAVHSGMLALAAGRTTLSPRKKFGVPLLAAMLLAAWLAWAVLAVGDRVIAPVPAALIGQLVQRPALAARNGGVRRAGRSRAFRVEDSP